MTESVRIGIAAGDGTESLLQAILDELETPAQGDPAIDLDDVGVDRELADTAGLAGEPITIGVIITGGAIVVSAVLRIIERRMEHAHQLKMMRIVVEAEKQSPDLSRTLAEIAKKNAEVSIGFGLAKEAWGGAAKPESP